jgi:hypothetical protein
MTTANEHQPTNLKQAKSGYPTLGEMVAGIIWVGFYLAIIAISIVSPLNLNAIEIASRH